MPFLLHHVKTKAIIIAIISTIVPVLLFSQDITYLDRSKTSGPFSKPSKEIKELSIGDLVPEIEFQMLNYKSPTARLSDFKGKIVILDFWATWCGSCISAFPKMDSLQKLFGDRVQIIPVSSKASRDTKAMLEKFLQKWQGRKGKIFPLPTAFSDTIAYSMFPHNNLPHCVWIGSDGLLKAISHSTYVTESNIITLLKTGDIFIKKKVDFLRDRPMFTGENTRIDNNSRFSFFFKGELKGLDKLTEFRVGDSDTGLVLTGLALRNCSLVELYREGLRHSFSLPAGFNIERHIILESKGDPGLFSYDMVKPLNDTHSLVDAVLTDLNNLSGYHGRFEMREVECIVLSDAPENKVINSSSTEIQNPGSIDNDITLSLVLRDLANSLSTDFPGIGFPVVNESSYSGRVSVTYSAFSDILKLTEQLSYYRINVSRGIRKVRMFVISDKQ